MKPALLVALALLAACANLPDISNHECGNGVLDDKEDCDSSDANCIQCKIACTHPAGDPTPLPTCELGGEVVPGYRCGADDRCHAPSGVFGAERTSFEFAVNHGLGGDLDGDGIQDVIGFSDINIDVHFGDPAAALTTESSAIVPFANTNPTVRRVRIEGSLAEKADILIPTPDGIGAYSAEDHQIVPYPFANDPRDYAMCDALGPPNTPVGLYAIDKRNIAIVTRDPSNALSVSVMDPTRPHCNTLPMCGLGLRDGDGLQLDTYASNQAGTTLVAFTVLKPEKDPTQSAAGVCLLRTAAQAGPPLIEKLRGPFPIGYPFPASLLRTKPGDTCPSMVATSSDGTRIQQWAAQLDPGGGCTVAVVPKDMPLAAPSRPVARIALDPPVAGQAPDALAMVTFTGTNEGVGDVYLVNDTALALAYHSQRALYPVHSGDVDGDGRVDAIGSSALRFSSSDIDVLYRSGVAGASFLPYRIPTRTAPRFVQLGDFDGNGISDIIYVETVGGRDELMVSYGTKDRPTPPVAITSFAHITGLAVIDVPDSLDRNGGLFDDVLVAEATATSAQVTLFHGNPQRSMLAFFDPGLELVGNELVSLVQGNFTPKPGSDGFPHDVVAFGRVQPGSIAPMVGPKMWLVEGASDGEGLNIARTARDLPTDNGSCTNVPLCVRTSHFLAWPGPDGHDVVIAIDDATDPDLPRHVVTFDPTGTSITMQAAPAQVIAAMPSDLTASVFAADLDGDGKNELWVGLASAPGTGATSDVRLLRCEVGANAVVSSCTDVSPAANAVLPHPAGLDWHCASGFDADLELVSRKDPAPPRKGTDVIGLCYLGAAGPLVTSAVVKLHAGPNGVEAQPLSGVIHAAFVARGDVDGDALDDLVMVVLTLQGLATLHIFPQCQATDADCIAHGITPAAVTP